MENYKVKINYLYNSGFTVETENYLLIFDYYKDSTDKGDKCISNGAVGEEDLKTQKKVIVFSSHSHFDHFNPIILKWKQIRPDIHYILSSDINIDKNDRNNYINMLSVYEALHIDNLYVKAFSSNDIGISFLVKVDNITIFHSGDLNWWHWWDENEEFNSKMEKSFKSEIEKIKSNSIDIAFFPVDSRLKEYYFIGGEYFIKKINPNLFIPMHFREDFNVTKKFKEKIKAANTKIVDISKRGEQILY
ncbi:MAG: MBL fold metallo-hydrolase [Clostridium beijerinckii]